jgi:anti-sigma B factor antagonist
MTGAASHPEFPGTLGRPVSLVFGYLRGLRKAAISRGEEVRDVPLKITSREMDGITILQMEGRIVLGEESNSLRERVKNLLATNKFKIVMNMGEVTYIDSAGLGTLVAAFHSARNQGAVLKLSNLGQKFQEVLQVTKLLTVFEVFDSEAAAIQSFGK